MIAKAGHQDVHTDLAQALQEFWDEYAGIHPARIRVVSGEGAIAIWLEEVLSPAERQMAGTQEGRKMLQELGERILEQARPQLRQLVADTVEQEDIQVEVHLDAAEGNLVGFFWLG
jgi:uncharacterized protein YbcI